MKDYAPNVAAVLLEKRETSQTGMPLLADLLFNRKAG
jgi:hypothetical protein